MTRIHLFICTVTLLFGCQVKQSDYVDTDLVKREIKSREFKKLTDAQIMNGAYEQGKKLSNKILTEHTFTSHYCDSGELFTQYADSICQTVRLVCAEQNTQDKTEAAIWQAYQHNYREDMDLSDNIQELNEAEYLYSHPIVLENDSAKSFTLLNIVINKKEMIKTL
ncbi:hypothetical protein AAG747_01310 [Rapidithrix thailandica]|uniref:Uncharacterized protein n=1 Tax=Rapidithrix thailandica TaxID=413964 RepID=A0AAW9S275_9BACT